jgi:hypothetical protein
MHRPSAFRFVILLWGALMTALPAAEAVADARIAAASGDARIHVEDEQRSDCARVHAHDCALCQHLATVSLPQSRAGIPSRLEATSVAAAVREDAAGAAWCAAARPRAPPALA